MFPGRKEKIVCTIEARMGSSRLPGKVLLPLRGEPALARMVERVRRSRYVDEVVVATTTGRPETAIVDACDRMGCASFRGSEQDVLARVLGAARSVGGDIIVELTGDCPLIDHRHIDEVVEAFYDGEWDYASNALVRSYPDGFDVQVFPVSVLAEVDRLTDDPIDRVHVSYYIYTHPERFRCRNVKAEGVMDWPECAVTLDEPEDYRLIQAVYDELHPRDPDFSALDVVRLLRARPELLDIVRDIRRKSPEEG